MSTDAVCSKPHVAHRRVHCNSGSHVCHTDVTERVGAELEPRQPAMQVYRPSESDYGSTVVTVRRARANEITSK